MNRIVNWFKDFIYNITDYGIIAGVVVVVAAILVWRFNILFTPSVQKQPIVAVTNETPSINTEINSNNENENNNTEAPNTNDETGVNNEQPTQPNTPVDVAQSNSSKEVNITIPSGSFPSKIADILVNAGLIDDKAAFLDRSVALALDTKLKSGDYTIAQGETVDNILKILSK